ncbi:hypothetical protein C7M84_008514 [Penaeus vannamei]|uniref:NIPSNAP domain-containing protein n=1 Tax=Penaeus vannamei TaxID=6689 RepID=A0A3R7P1U0_PENVA|nr:hypothetical protein C7M84_008514 [Penaeus vannamei]
MQQCEALENNLTLNVQQWFTLVALLEGSNFEECKYTAKREGRESLHAANEPSWCPVSEAQAGASPTSQLFHLVGGGCTILLSKTSTEFHKNKKMALWRTIGLPSRGTVARCSLQISSSRSLSAAAKQEPVYELRTYTVYPDKMREYLTITAEEFHLRTAHSKPLGFWTAEVGGLNQVVHIWEYESLAHRSTIRANLAGDSEWMSKYVSRVAGMWQQQDNSLMTLLPGTSLALPSGTAIKIMTPTQYLTSPPPSADDQLDPELWTNTSPHPLPQSPTPSLLLRSYPPPPSFFLFLYTFFQYLP